MWRAALEKANLLVQEVAFCSNARQIPSQDTLLVAAWLTGLPAARATLHAHFLWSVKVKVTCTP